MLSKRALPTGKALLHHTYKALAKRLKKIKQ